MEEISEILARINLNRNMTSQNSAKYNCNKCKDNTWIESENGYKRCDCYEVDRVKSLWKNFGVSPDDIKKINEYKPYDEITNAARQKSIEYINRFDEIKENRENSLGLFGQPGGGKTHLIVAIGTALLNRDTNPIACVYMPYIEAMRALKSNANDEEEYNKVLWKYQKAKLLIIDDLFKDKVKNGSFIKDKYGYEAGLSEADLKHIYPIINHRYINKLPTLISSECTPSMLFELDDAIAGRILESCGNNIVVFSTNHNFRMRKYEGKA